MGLRPDEGARERPAEAGAQELLWGAPRGCLSVKARGAGCSSWAGGWATPAAPEGTLEPDLDATDLTGQLGKQAHHCGPDGESQALETSVGCLWTSPVLGNYPAITS